jgi:hypothetical protein
VLDASAATTQFLTPKGVSNALKTVINAPLNNHASNAPQDTLSHQMEQNAISNAVTIAQHVMAKILIDVYLVLQALN